MPITYVDTKCANCDTTFKVRPADLSRGWGKFCSKSCKQLDQEKKRKFWDTIRGKKTIKRKRRRR